MEWFKEKGDLLALIAILLIIFTWLKTDIADMRADLKADIAKVEANIATKADKTDIIDIRNLLISHITDGHKHRTQDRKTASEPPKSKNK